MGSLDLVTLPATSAGSTIANTIPNHVSTRDKESALRDVWSMAMQDEDPEAGWSRSFFCCVGPLTKNGLSSMWNSFPAVPRMYSVSLLTPAKPALALTDCRPVSWAISCLSSLPQLGAGSAQRFLTWDDGQ